MYAVLLRAYPRGFRLRYGRQMTQLFRDKYRDAGRNGGGLSITRLWFETLLDVAVNATGERAIWFSRGLLQRRRRHGPRRRESFGSIPRSPLTSFRLQEVRYALRSLRRRPTVTLAAVLSLALGIAATTAIFSIIHGVLISSLPYKDSDRLVFLREYDIERGLPKSSDRAGVSVPNLLDWRDQNRVFESVAAVGAGTYLLLGDGEPERLSAAPVSGNVFQLLGVDAALGRTFTSDEGSPGGERVVVLSDGLWKRRFGADETVLGKTVSLDGDPFVVIGVMPPAFQYPGYSELWIPLHYAPHTLWQRRGVRAFAGLARLDKDVSLEQAQGEMDLIAARLELQYPEANANRKIQVLPMKERIVAGIRPTLLVLFGAGAFLLLIACVNVVNLLLARASDRRTEMAVRAALGAGRRHLIQQALMESIILSLLGGAVGLLFASWGMDAIVAHSPDAIPRIDEVSLNSSVLGFTTLISLGTGVLIGSLPALRFSRSNIVECIGNQSRVMGRQGRRLHDMLVVSEMALALVLLIGAGLFVRSFFYLWQFESGFESQNVLAIEISLNSKTYPGAEEREAFFEELFERLVSRSRVERAGSINRIPVDAGDITWSIVPAQNGASSGRSEPLDVRYRTVRGDYFGTLQIPLVAGRVFTSGDKNHVLVNDRVVQILWSGRNPVGKRIKLGRAGDDNPWLEVVGVVGSVRHGGLDPEPKPEIYVPGNPGFGYVVVRASGDPLEIVGDVKEEIWRLDADQPITSIKSMDRMISGSIARPRFFMWLFTVFGAVALILAAVGVFGVASYSVSQRTREIGVRMALGARRVAVVRLILLPGLMLAGLGAVIGMASAFTLRRLVAGLMYGVTSSDVATFGSAAVILILVALVAFCVLTLRATRVDPLIVLRAE